jgi:murein DD-endopeptidase MepM/ murein hydrolase activator NlpD
VNPFRSKEIIYPDSFYIDCRSFVLPIDTTIKVTSVFGIRNRRMHNGIDLKVQKGDTIRAAFSGKVRIKGFERRGFGNYLVLRHPNGLETLYGHLSGFIVSENEIVKAGQPIGLGGNTGRSTGTHLHFETRFLGQALNPGHIIDFDNGGVPRNDQYVLYKGNFGKNTNIYTSTSERIVYHRVQSGETLGKIALQYKTSVAELCRLNGLTQNSILRIGQTIRCGTTIVNTVPKETKPTIAETTEVTKTPEVAKIPDETISNITQIETSQPVYYRIKEGDTLSAIAQKHGTTINKLCELNNITRTTVLRIGRSLRCS